MCFSILTGLIILFITRFALQKELKEVTDELFSFKLVVAIEVFKDYVKSEYKTLKLQNYELVDDNGVLIRKRFEIVDKISKMMDVLVTIFQVDGDDFVRISTSIKKDDETRAVGTYSRAGKVGKGFAVVADEIRKLAEESKQVAGEIGRILKEIQKSAEEASNATVKTVKVVKDVAENSIVVNQKLLDILSEIDKK